MNRMKIPYNIILASQSPRRQELLRSLNISFVCKPVLVEETYPAGLVANEITEYLAKKKSSHFGNVKSKDLIITADTIVWNKDHPLEKPKNIEEAKNFLREISNTDHTVYTSVGFTTSEGTKIFTDSAKIYLSELSDEEIDFYITNYRPLDKAGSYGIQDWIGLSKIYKIEGSYYTIMGLPTHIVYEYLKSIK